MVFEATVKLHEEESRLSLDSLRGKQRTLTINGDSRRKKLASLLALLKRQGLTPDVEYTADEEGNPVAVVRAAS